MGSFCSSRRTGGAARLLKARPGASVRARLLKTLIHRPLRMQMRTWRGRIWAARLGLLALTVNALVPVHLAFDLAEAIETQQCSAHVDADAGARRLLAWLSGHHEADGKSHEHHKHHACPVCSTLNALAGFALAAPPALSFPTPAGLPAAPFVIQAERTAAPAAYRSRAPPPA